MRVIDKYTEINKAKWENITNKESEQYSRPWKDIDPNLIIKYINDEIVDLPENMNWIYPKTIFKDVKDKKVLCLASGGGQQSVIFSLLGAQVTVVDISERQLALDQEAAEHYGYPIHLINEDMRNLRFSPSDSFDIVYQPVSICFVPDIASVYSEVYRVLKNNGLYAVGHCNPTTVPVWFFGGRNGWDGIGYRIAEPYICGEIKINENGNENMTVGQGIGEFRHSLSDIFNKLIQTGFKIEGVYEDPRSLTQNTKKDPPDIHSMIVSYFKIVARK